MKIKEIFILKEAIDDLKIGKSFYENQAAGIGSYFWDSLISDLTSLNLYGGVHSKVFGLYKMVSKRFPYAIYYQITNANVYVIGILPMRRDPVWIRNKLQQRNQ